MRDVGNAFPSPSHEKMSEMIASHFHDSRAALLKHRFKESMIIIKTATGAQVLLHPRCGGLQGDVTMPDMFGSL